MKKHLSESAYIGANVDYLEALNDDILYHEHEAARSNVVESLRKPVVSSGGNELLNSYQMLGSRYADLNPLAATTNSLPANSEYQNKYCGKIAFDYMHIASAEKKQWWQEVIDQRSSWAPNTNDLLTVYSQLQQAEQMEHILSRKFVGQTRFSLEGCDALIPLIESIITLSARDHGLKEVVLGMPHRGRLNVMQNIMGMKFSSLCDLYSGVRECVNSSSDVTYHMGYSSDRDFAGNEVHLSLAFNPSHLEFIAPVVMGSVRARQESGKFACKSAVMPLILHGDAAIAGQGVVAEWFNMMHTEANNIFGAVHIVVNNQLGFTTDNSVARSGAHPTDPHKYADMPVIHVNADDVHSVLYAAKCAASYRAHFSESVMINLVGYRRFGHNEGDDPSFTQPEMYKTIKSHPSVLKIFEQELLAAGLLDTQKINAISGSVAQTLKDGARTVAILNNSKTISSWEEYRGEFDLEIANTAISQAKLEGYTSAITNVPADFNLHKQILKLITEYKNAVLGKTPIRWGFAEQLAYASLLGEGYGIRLVGQDVERGTFSHRHAVWTDQKNSKKHCPLAGLAIEPNKCDFFNSTLSEQAVVAFEYGYSLVDPKTLTIWEAQYGDFCNGAQVIIDQFISSSWQKWKRMSGLVLLLPHGYEGAGPEHSSARLERFLQLAAEDNMRVCMPSTAAQIFHLLRLQMHQKARVPLIVMSPKSSLRLPEAMSDISEFTSGSFKPIISDSEITNKSKVKRVILCSGKVYFDLVKHRSENNIDNTAIIRVEQLYPYDVELCRRYLSEYKSLKEVVWTQEEPKNQGSWYTIRHNIEDSMPAGVKLACVARAKSASPAAGYKKLHQQRQALVIENSFKEI